VTPLAYSVVIAAYRRPGLLRQTLAHLLPQVGPDGEVIVVEQCPAVDLRAELAAQPRVRHEILLTPGAVEARNHGIRLARGDVLLFVDDDVVTPPGFVAAHLAGYADPAVGGVAGRVVEASRPPAADPDPRSFDPADGWRWSTFDHTHAMDVPHAPTCNLSLRRAAVVRAGGFDPAFRLAWREDSDLCFRVRALGYRIRFSPAAWLTHLSASEGGTRAGAAAAGYWGRERRLIAKHFRHYRDNLYFILRHFDGPRRRRWLADAYRTYVGASRWPWRLAGKNAAFALALWQAAALARHRRHHPLRFDL
jgi:GT2 family glycosyltransferase